MRTTEEVARELAKQGRASAPRDVGYAGRKDRAAVTRQWFSVRGLALRDARALVLRGARVLEAAQHRNKLRTGHLKGNRFELVVDERRRRDARARARAPRGALERGGMVNRFGEQRFGRDGENAERALALLRGERPRGERGRLDRREQRFLLSALQAAVFNDFLCRARAAARGARAGRHRAGALFGRAVRGRGPRRRGAARGALRDQPDRAAVRNAHVVGGRCGGRARARAARALGDSRGRRARSPRVGFACAGRDVRCARASAEAALRLPGARNGGACA